MEVSRELGHNKQRRCSHRMPGVHKVCLRVAAFAQLALAENSERL
jgi:hypothetical protein